MKTLFPKFLIIFLMIFFAFVVISGLLLIKQSTVLPDSQKITQINTQSEVVLEVSKDKVKVEIVSAVTGLIVTVIGLAGLILMLIKVPVKQIVTQTLQDCQRDSSFQQYLPNKPQLSVKTEQIPLLLWWLIRKKKIAIKV